MWQDGSAALPPAEILPPDEWEWVSDWKIDGSGLRDMKGWEYTKELGKFDASRGERSANTSNAFGSLVICMILDVRGRT